MNQCFEVSKCEIDGVYVVQPFNSDDIRGCFTKDFSKKLLNECGIEYDIEEIFYTTSHKGTIRALHFQREKQQPKMVRCISGKVYDVVVDLRRNSATFKKWIGFELSGDNKVEIIVPSGCAHGYLVLEESIVSYKCAEAFYAEFDDGIKWDDSDIMVNWPLELIGGEGNIIISEKDSNLQSFAAFMEIYGGL